MTIGDLLKVLKNLHPDFKLTVWHNGERLRLTGIDTSFFEDGFIELNAEQ